MGRILRPKSLSSTSSDHHARLTKLERGGVELSAMPFDQSIDAGHPMDLYFPISTGYQPPIALLSFKFLPYRSTSSSAGGATGAESAVHSHGHSHTSAASVAHSHGHSHTWHIAAGAATQAINSAGAGVVQMATVTDDIPTTTVATSTTPGTPGSTGSDASNESAIHTHSVGGSSLGVSEGTSTTIAALAVDGVDKTSILGGPWAADTVDLDVAAVLPLGDGHWHRITLTTAGQGRIVAVLKIAI